MIDAEVVAYDRGNRVFLPFQILSTRKRKFDSAIEGVDSQKVKVILQIFDLLNINGKSLLRESLRVRREILRKAFSHTESYLHFASSLDSVEDADTAPIESFLNESCQAACEGLMIKTLDENATYEPSKRSLNWLKLKKDYINGMGVCDSVDLVPLGGYHGKGKRTNVYGGFLMACYDPDRDEYLSVCKVSTGFKDEDLERLTRKYREKVVLRQPSQYNVDDRLVRNMGFDWFETKNHENIVWELFAADLSRSSLHRGGIGRIENDLQNNDGNSGLRGIGLRFPRFIREREDKRCDQATSAEQIVELFLNQSGNNNNRLTGKKENDDDGNENEGEEEEEKKDDENKDEDEWI
jgi:DNA ligase-1